MVKSGFSGLVGIESERLFNICVRFLVCSLDGYNKYIELVGGATGTDT